MDQLREPCVLQEGEGKDIGPRAPLRDVLVGIEEELTRLPVYLRPSSFFFSFIVHRNPAGARFPIGCSSGVGLTHDFRDLFASFFADFSPRMGHEFFKREQRPLRLHCAQGADRMHLDLLIIEQVQCCFFCL